MDTELFNLMKRFEKDSHLIISDGHLARQMVKKPKIKKLRQSGELIVARDRSKKITLFFKKPPI